MRRLCTPTLCRDPKELEICFKSVLQFTAYFVHPWRHSTATTRPDDINDEIGAVSDCSPSLVRVNATPPSECLLNRRSQSLVDNGEGDIISPYGTAADRTGGAKS